MAFKICVIGCGHITQHSHGPAYRQYAAEHPDVELAACCDLDVQRAEKVRAEFGFARAYSDAFDMLAREQPTAVCLNVPVQHTAALSEQILALGIPLMAEKPPALTTAELDGVIAAQQAARPGGLHQVAFNRRFAPLVAALKELLRGRQVLHVEHTFTRVNRRDPDFSTTAIHGIDTLRHLLGEDYAGLHMHYPALEANDAQRETGQPPIAAYILSGHFQSGASVHMTFQPLSGLASERTVVYTPGATFSLRLNHALDAPGHLFHYYNQGITQSFNVTGAT
jgi:myo-inositol 2-dehydrogenase / D-chiro-inositol 1-dehydrogenase